MKLFHINGPAAAFRAIFGWLFLLIGCYFLAALVGSLVPVNNEWREPEKGVELFVETNGVHVSLIIPMQAAGEDLSDLIRPQDLSDPTLYGTHAMIGWGHEGVYRNAATWGDVHSGDVASAAFGSNKTVLHIYHRINPGPNKIRRKFLVTVDEYRKIIRQIRGSFKLNRSGMPTHYPGYSADNLFYAATGRYSAFHTCNVWTANLLQRAGVRIGVWTPMAGGVMRWFANEEQYGK